MTYLQIIFCLMTALCLLAYAAYRLAKADAEDELLDLACGFYYYCGECEQREDMLESPPALKHESPGPNQRNYYLCPSCKRKEDAQ